MKTLHAFGPRQLDEVVALWAGLPGSSILLGGNKNSVYGFMTHDRELVLRLTPEDHRDAGEIQAEIDWVRHLSNAGSSVCAPIQAAGIDVHEVIDPSGRGYTASVFERAEGTRGVLGKPGAWKRAFFERWGMELGRIHSLSRTFNPRSAHTRISWTGEALMRMAHTILPGEQATTIRHLERLLSHIEALPRGPEGYGMLHGDLNLSNFAVKNGALSIFDFDDCSPSWFAYDLAVVLLMTVFEVVLENPEAASGFATIFFASFMLGYRREHELDQRWMADLPEFIALFNTLVFISFFDRMARGDMPYPRLVDFVSSNEAADRVDLGVDFETAYAEVIAQQSP